MSEILVMGAVKCLSCIFLSDHTKLQSAETDIRAQSENERDTVYLITHCNFGLGRFFITLAVDEFKGSVAV